MGKQTRVLTQEEYELIINTIKTGALIEGRKVKPNIRISTILVLQANLGMRIGDIVNLKLDSIIFNGPNYRLDIIEMKTGKKRNFTVPNEIYLYLKNYCYDKNIKPSQRIFNISIRSIQRHLKLICDFLHIEGISTHSFRKFYATNTYKDSNYNVVIVKELLQHKDTATTLKYIGVSAKEIEEVINKNIRLL